MPLEVAAPPLVLRSSMDDDGTLRRFTKTLMEVATAVKGARFVTTHDEKLQLAASALFYGAFAVSGLRSLGEEHVGLMPVTFNEKLRRYFLHYATGGGRVVAQPNAQGQMVPITVPPSVGAQPLTLLRRLILAVLLMCEGLILRRFAAKFFPETDRQTVLARIQSIHMTFFFLFGAYACLPHRLTGTRYLSLTPSYQHQYREGGPEGTNPYWKLGLMLAIEHIYLLVEALRAWKKREVQEGKREQKRRIREGRLARANRRRRSSSAREGYSSDDEEGADGSTSSATKGSASTALGGQKAKKKEEDDDDEEDEPGKPTAGSCMLCLSKRRTPTATACGHIFCWECITHWLKGSKVCPLCRYQCVPQQLVPLVGYRTIAEE